MGLGGIAAIPSVSRDIHAEPSPGGVDVAIDTSTAQIFSAEAPLVPPTG